MGMLSHASVCPVDFALTVFLDQVSKIKSLLQTAGEINGGMDRPDPS